MPRSIFVSYKYSDSDVRPLSPVPTSIGTLLSGLPAPQPQLSPLQSLYGGVIPTAPTTARDYVDDLSRLLDSQDHLYKGENDGESLARFKDDTIASKLRDKIFYSSITIVLLSKNMKALSIPEEDQWIPWEVAYSLKEMTRNGRTSRTNGMLAVALPDRNGSYEYAVRTICASGCRQWQTDSMFSIIGGNMFNRKQPNAFYCQNHPGGGAMYSGYDHSYLYPVTWDQFVGNINWHIELASQLSQRTEDFEIVKMV